MTTSFAPVSLSYIAALRGIKAAHPGEAFTYALVNCGNPELLIGLAASNPEGQFFGIVSDTELCNKGTAEAAERQVSNITFLNMSTNNLVKGAASLPALDYLACDESGKALTHIERAALFDLASKCLKPSGLLSYRYKAFDDPMDALRFIVREFAPEMSVEQANDFLIEIKKLGHLYLQSRPDLVAKLNEAIAKQIPDEFFMMFDDGEARSATFDTLVGMRARGMVFAGAGEIAANYVELSVPKEAQAIIVECRDNPLYQPLKDFASLTSVRSDIWCKPPANMSANPAELFGSFAYGIPMPEDKVPTSVEVFGKTVELSSPLYKKLIGLMTMQPLGIGDFMQHPDGADFTASQIIEALQILVALNIARPMRGAREAADVSNLAQPRFCGDFNRYIDKLQVATDQMAMASRVLGDVMSISPRDALVMQALNRAGLANSVSALLPELERLAKDPASSAQLMDLAEPTAESAYNMINDTVSRSIVQWYAYGLLEAA